MSSCVAVDKNGNEFIYDVKPIRSGEHWDVNDGLADSYVELPKGAIKKLIGRELTWASEPVELKEGG